MCVNFTFRSSLSGSTSWQPNASALDNKVVKSWVLWAAIVSIGKWVICNGSLSGSTHETWLPNHLPSTLLARGFPIVAEVPSISPSMSSSHEGTLLQLDGWWLVDQGIPLMLKRVDRIGWIQWQAYKSSESRISYIPFEAYQGIIDSCPAWRQLIKFASCSSCTIFWNFRENLEDR